MANDKIPVSKWATEPPATRQPQLYFRAQLWMARPRAIIAAPVPNRAIAATTPNPGPPPPAETTPIRGVAEAARAAGALVAADRGDAVARARALTMGVAGADGAGDTVDVALTVAGGDGAGAARAGGGVDDIALPPAGAAGLGSDAGVPAGVASGAIGMADDVGVADVVSVADGVGVAVAEAVGDGVGPGRDCGLKLPARLP